MLAVRAKRRNVRRKPSCQLLKAEKNNLKEELEKTKEGIVDDNKRKANPSYTPYENRQRLARASSDTVSKLQRVERNIVTKEKAHKEKIQRKMKTRLKNRTIGADKQHKRLIKMTTNLEKLKLGEKALRVQIAQEKGEEKAKQTASNGEGLTSHLPPIKSNSPEWLRISPSRCETSLSNLEIDGREDDSRPVSAQSEPVIELGRSARKRLVADKLAHKYDMTRELRNTIHEHMISRSYSFSYFNIIPPYKRKKPKPQKTKQVFNRLVYEDKIGVVDFNKKFPQKVFLRP